MINQFKTALLMGVLAVILIAIGSIWGTSGMVIALVLALVMNVATYWYSDRLVLWMYQAKPASRHQYKQLYAMVKEITEQMELPMPDLYIISNNTPNAFATGRNPEHAAIACTTALLQLLDEDELRGVLAHEAAHIKNRDILITTIATTIVAVISYVAMIARWSALFGDNDHNWMEWIAIAIIAPIAALLIQLAISRAREYHADRTAAQVLGTGEPLASALIRLEHGVREHPLRSGSTATASLFIVNPFQKSFFVRMLSTHPPTQQRVQALRAI